MPRLWSKSAFLSWVKTVNVPTYGMKQHRTHHKLSTWTSSKSQSIGLWIWSVNQQLITSFYGDLTLYQPTIKGYAHCLQEIRLALAKLCKIDCKPDHQDQVSLLRQLTLHNISSTSAASFRISNHSAGWQGGNIWRRVFFTQLLSRLGYLTIITARLILLMTGWTSEVSEHGHPNLVPLKGLSKLVSYLLLIEVPTWWIFVIAEIAHGDKALLHVLMILLRRFIHQKMNHLRQTIHAFCIHQRFVVPSHSALTLVQPYQHAFWAKHRVTEDSRILQS